MYAVFQHTYTCPYTHKPVLDAHSTPIFISKLYYIPTAPIRPFFFKFMGVFSFLKFIYSIFISPIYGNYTHQNKPADTRHTAPGGGGGAERVGAAGGDAQGGGGGVRAGAAGPRRGARYVIWV